MQSNLMDKRDEVLIRRLREEDALQDRAVLWEAAVRIEELLSEAPSKDDPKRLLAIIGRQFNETKTKKTSPVAWSELQSTMFENMDTLIGDKIIDFGGFVDIAMKIEDYARQRMSKQGEMTTEQAMKGLEKMLTRPRETESDGRTG
jgi:hypothetical protein